jgi:hypothetical protein
MVVGDRAGVEAVRMEAHHHESIQATGVASAQAGPTRSDQTQLEIVAAPAKLCADGRESTSP